jgi:hypothetical protein
MRRMENQGFGYTVWLDNLFTSARLLKRLNRNLELHARFINAVNV